MTVGQPLKPHKPPGEADTGELLAQVEDDRHYTEASSVTELKREIISDGTHRLPNGRLLITSFRLQSQGGLEPVSRSPKASLVDCITARHVFFVKDGEENNIQLGFFVVFACTSGLYGSMSDSEWQRE